VDNLGKHCVEVSDQPVKLATEIFGQICSVPAVMEIVVVGLPIVESGA